MKMHPAIGGDAIGRAIEQAWSHADANLVNQAPQAFGFMRVARDIALYHHEKWDGSGYPSGLRGDKIPVSARLMALADVFDALVTRRVYKPPMSLEDATKIIVAGRAQHFDPAVVDAFLEQREVFAEIAARYPDVPEPDAASAKAG